MNFLFQFKGATKEIGTALTRICLRHKAMEAKLKSFTSSIMDCLIIPLQKRLEEWNKTTGNLHKEYGKGKMYLYFAASVAIAQTCASTHISNHKNHFRIQTC